MDISKVINLKLLTTIAGVDYWSLYYRKVGKYTTPLDLKIRTKVANTLVDELTPFLKALGFTITLNQKGRSD